MAKLVKGNDQESQCQTSPCFKLHFGILLNEQENQIFLILCKIVSGYCEQESTE